jgi:hypothetical protein
MPLAAEVAANPDAACCLRDRLLERTALVQEFIRQAREHVAPEFEETGATLLLTNVSGEQEGGRSWPSPRGSSDGEHERAGRGRTALDAAAPVSGTRAVPLVRLRDGRTWRGSSVEGDALCRPPHQAPQ